MHSKCGERGGIGRGGRRKSEWGRRMKGAGEKKEGAGEKKDILQSHM